MNVKAFVRLVQGDLQGNIVQTINGLWYSSFKGIPYAVPPVGSLRFSAPLAHEKWEGVFEANEHRGVCPQWESITGETIEGNEDCLYLNVYAPFIKDDSIPVMVWFHGGSFQSGSGNSDLYGPDYLIEENVVLVTVNYRLEVFGFLSLETEEVPGNAGLKDQVMALKWVKNNISHFGGDPNNVTIFGESAGGISCTYHLISPMSRGLFHRMIAQSGNFFNEWSTSYNNVDRAFRLGKYLSNKNTDNKLELLSYLRSVPAVKFIKVSFALRTDEEKFKDLPLNFCPVKEKIYKGKESFLPKSPEECLAEKDFADVPILVGYNNREGISFLKDALRKSKIHHKDLTRRIPRDIYDNLPRDYLISMGELVRKFYYGDKTIGEDTQDETIDMETDYIFSYGIQKFAREMAKNCQSPVYLYRFSVDGELNLLKKGRLDHFKGASHADELFYLFKTFLKVNKKSKEYKAIKKMTRMWTNFAKYGNPTPKDDEFLPVKWKPITSKEVNFLDIDFEPMSGVNPDNERFEFWSELYKKFEEYKTNIEKL